jgi:hypothetical protein
MWHRVPVVALASSAVPETVGGAGMVLPVGAAAAVVAAAVDRVLGDGSVRDELVARGVVRLEEFSLVRTRARFAEAIAGVIEGAEGGFDAGGSGSAGGDGRGSAA